jgi:hypothetical protein
MGKKSRDKGSRGQREVAKLLSPWWGAEFTSTPMSGGFATKRFRDDWNAAADIVTPDETFPFSVEVKWQEDWNMEQLLTSDVTKMWKWWDQCIEEAPADKIPLLVFKRNRQPWYYMIEEKKGTLIQGRSFKVLMPKRKKKLCERRLKIGLFQDLLKTIPEKW